MANSELGAQILKLSTQAITTVFSIAENAPFVAPVAKAMLLLFNAIETARVQKENCLQFSQLLVLISDALASAQKSLTPQDRVLADLVQVMDEAREFVTDYSKPRLFIMKLVTASSDQEQFESLTQRLMDRVKLLTAKLSAEVNTKVDQVLQQLRSGTLFTQADAEQAQLKSMVDEMGGVQAVVNDEAKYNAVLKSMSTTDQLILLELDRGLHHLITHREARGLWKQLGGMQESLSIDTFVLALSDYFVKYEKPAGVFPFQLGARTLQDSVKRACVVRCLDLDRDNRISVSELKEVLVPDTLCLEDIVLQLAERPAPSNLPPLPADQMPRPSYEDVVFKRMSKGAGKHAALVGPSGSGKSWVARVVGHRLLRDNIYPGGVFWIDVRACTTLNAVLKALAFVMKLPGDIGSDRELAYALKQRVTIGFSTCLILDNVEDVLRGEDRTDFVELLQLLNSECTLMTMLLTSIDDPALPLFPVTAVAAPSVAEAREWLLAHHPDAGTQIDALLTAAPPASAKAVAALRQQLDAGSQGQTLTQSIQHLPASQQTALAQLCLFPASFAEAAAAVGLGIDPSVLRALVDRQLVDRTNGGRYSLHSTVQLAVREGLGEAKVSDLQKNVQSTLIRWTLDEMKAASNLYETGNWTAAIAFMDRERPLLDLVLHLLTSMTPVPVEAGKILGYSLLTSRFTHNELLPPLKHILAEHTDAKEASEIKKSIAFYLRGQQPQEALRYAEEAYQLALQARTSDDDAALTCIAATLANVYDDLGRHTDALELHEKVLEARRRIHGEDDLNTLTAMSALAGTYASLGRHQDALSLQEKVLEARRRILGAEHPRTINAMGNLAAMYLSLCRHQDALLLQEKVLEVSRRILGDEHPDTIASMGNLAATYSSLCQHQDALLLQEKVLEARRRILGDEHPSTFISMDNLAATYSNVGRYQDALLLCQEKLEIRRKVQGEEHGYTLLTLDMLLPIF